jgi:quinol monooxygenase YgiN
MITPVCPGKRINMILAAVRMNMRPEKRRALLQTIQPIVEQMRKHTAVKNLTPAYRSYRVRQHLNFAIQRTDVLVIMEESIDGFFYCLS